MERLPAVHAPIRSADIEWRDGEPFSREFQDIYFSRKAGAAETEHVFLQGNGLPERWKTHPDGFFAVGELGFGTGLNFLVTQRAFLAHAPKSLRLVFFSVESRPLSPDDLTRSHAAFPEFEADAAALRSCFPPPLPGFHQLKFHGGRITLVLMLGGVEDMLSRLSGPFHAWYLDGFAPGRNPDMWKPSVIRRLADISVSGATAATYSESAVVLRSLEAAGFAPTKAPGHGAKKAMTVAVLSTGGVRSPSRHVQTAGVIGAGFAGCCASRSLAERGVQVRNVSAPNAHAASLVPTSVYMPIPTTYPTAMARWTSQGTLAVWRRVALLKIPHIRGVFEAADSAQPSHLESLQWPQDFASVAGPEESLARTGINAGRGFLFKYAGTLKSHQYCDALLAHDLIECVRGRVDSVERHKEDRTYSGRSEGRHMELGDAVVLAGGADGQRLIDQSGIVLRLLYGRQYALDIEDIASDSPARSIRIPLADGLIVNPLGGGLSIGSSFERGSPHPDETILEETWNRSGNVLRGLIPLDVMQRAREVFQGARLCAKDNSPLIGPVPDPGQGWEETDPMTQPGTLTITALGSKGLVFSALAGEVVAAMVCGEPLPLEMDLVQALLPRRFHVRALKRLGQH